MAQILPERIQNFYQVLVLYYISELVAKNASFIGCVNKTVRYPWPSVEYEQTVVWFNAGPYSLRFLKNLWPIRKISQWARQSLQRDFCVYINEYTIIRNDENKLQKVIEFKRYLIITSKIEDNNLIFACFFAKLNLYIFDGYAMIWMVALYPSQSAPVSKKGLKIL